jgi:hypothetical protein
MLRILCGKSTRRQLRVSSRGCGFWRIRLNRLLVMAAASTVVLGLGGAVASRAQDETADKDLKAKVAQLIKELDSSKAAARQKAREELINLGRDALPLLPDEDAAELSVEQKRRLADVRRALGAHTGRTLAASKVSLKAKNVTLSDTIAEIRKQTGNDLRDIREDFGQPVTNPEFAVDWADKEFWQAMDELAGKSRVGYYLYTGERYLGLVMQPVPQTPVCYAGPLRIALNEIVRRLNFEDRQKQCTLRLEVAWEPSLKPMLFETKPDALEVVDEQGRKVAVEVEERPPGGDEEMIMKAPADSTMIRTDFIIRLAQPPKGAEKLSIKGQMTVTLPAEIQTFDFAEPTKAKNAKRTKGSVAVTLEQFKELEEGLWGADLVLEFDGGGEAFESYQTWYYDNEIYLQRADGTRFAHNGGTSQTESDGGRIGLQYRFVDAPGKITDYKLIYNTPSAIIRASVPFDFKDVELP